jgi:hypothetical protein
LRSLSVPSNLPVVAENFMKALEETMIEKEKQQEPMKRCGQRYTCQDMVHDRRYAQGICNDGFLPLNRADSQEFFLPFDEVDDMTEEELHTHFVETDGIFLAPLVVGQSLQGQQQHHFPPPSGREVAVAKLEEFFLGGPSYSTPPTYFETSREFGTSPLSTLDIDRALSTEQVSPSKAIAFQGDDSLGLLVEEGPELFCHSNAHKPTTSSHNHHHRHSFTKLTREGRTTSFPLEWASSSPLGRTVRRRSSLKKVSSYGQFPPTKPSSSSNTLKRNVSFGSMKIREFSVALSDNPCCSYGPPIGLSWDFHEKEEVPLDTYEASRQGNRRQGHSLLLSFYERHFLLIKQGGYSKKEIKETMWEVERVKRERMVTDLFLPASPLDETMEHILDVVKKYFRRSKATAPQEAKPA